LVGIDTTHTIIEFYTHFDDGRHSFSPELFSLEDTIEGNDLPAGDVNVDGNLSLADVIVLANYILKRSFTPPILNLCDVNADCKVDIVDIVYLVNVILRGRVTPRFGCVC